MWGDDSAFLEVGGEAECNYQRAAARLQENPSKHISPRKLKVRELPQSAPYTRQGARQDP